jgi:hypothetical protein
MSYTQCDVCEGLLARLSASAEELFEISFQISEALMNWQPGVSPPSSSELMSQAAILRAECAVIRELLQDHCSRQHHLEMSIAV